MARRAVTIRIAKIGEPVAPPDPEAITEALALISDEGERAAVAEKLRASYGALLRLINGNRRKMMAIKSGLGDVENEVRSQGHRDANARSVLMRRNSEAWAENERLRQLLREAGIDPAGK